MEDMKFALSVVIPTFNRKNSLAKTLDSLVDQSLKRELFEIIVVDDGSQMEQRRRSIALGKKLATL